MNWNELLVAALAGAVVALPFEFLAHKAWDTHKRRSKEAGFRKSYAFLARKYTNLRNGQEPTGGSVELTQNKDGTFSVVGLHADGSTEWEGALCMSLDQRNIGTATYKYLLRADYGRQHVVYIPERDVLHVVGRNESATAHAEFVHEWDPQIHVGRILT
jgi:hypothetical protein